MKVGSLLPIFLILLFVISPLFSLVIQSRPGIPTRLQLYNITVAPSAIPFKEDPAYYSFEAYRIMPPNVTPVVIHVATNLVFNNTGLHPHYIKVNIPKGNYSLILMNVSIREYNGIQYDRAAYIFVNGIPVFWGSTQEINNSTAEVDLTLFENLLQGNVTFEPVITNYYAPKVGITGLYSMNITLYLYPGPKPQGLPNEFIPLFVNFTPEKITFNYSYIILNPYIPSIMQTVNVPNGTYRMMLLLYEEGGGLDEFWYTNEPATRSIQLYYDNYLAGVVNPYETIYTGGIDLFYWKPLTSINTLAFHGLQLIDLTSFIALGSEANITVDVTNLEEAFQLTGLPYFDWDISAALLLWVNESNPLISAKLTTAQSQFMDSGPIFTPGFYGVYYQEDGHYYTHYSAILNFEHGTEVSNVITKGVFVAKQTFNSVFQYGYLDESFYENAKETGFYNASLIISGSYPITFTFDAVAIPITSTSVIPYNLSYMQNGTINLGLTYFMNWTYDSYNHVEKVHESLYAIGGFSGIIEIINRYGGAVLVALTSNNAITQKNLTATWLVNGKGFTEAFSAEGLQNSVVNFNGYYVYITQSFTPINGY